MFTTSRKRFAQDNPGHKHAVIQRLCTALCITLLAFVLSWLVAQPFSFSMSTLTSSQNRQDFNITDFYNVVANSRPVRNLESDIVIVNIDRTDRNDIVDLLNILSIMEPKAVGLDVTFNERRENDSILLQSIAEIPNLVLASTLQSGGVNEPDDNSWFYHDTRKDFNYGIVNLPSKYEGATIRQFPVWFADSTATKMPSFVVALAQIGAPETLQEINARGNQYETIDYPSHDFTILDWSEVPDHPEEIEGKIVLVGAAGDTSDIHATPINEKMTGVLIHAASLSTILHAHYYDTIPKWVVVLMAGILSVMIVFLSLSITTAVKGLTLRIVQVVLLYLVIRIGYSLFVDHRIILDFSYLLLMLTFVLFACDVWIGSTYLINKIKHRICHKSNADSYRWQS